MITSRVGQWQVYKKVIKFKQSILITLYENVYNVPPSYTCLYKAHILAWYCPGFCHRFCNFRFSLVWRWQAATAAFLAVGLKINMVYWYNMVSQTLKITGSGNAFLPLTCHDMGNLWYMYLDKVIMPCNMYNIMPLYQPFLESVEYVYCVNIV